MKLRPLFEMQLFKALLGVCLISAISARGADRFNAELLTGPATGADSVTITGGKQDAVVVVDTKDYEVVRLAAKFFADDVNRVSGRRLVVTNAPASAAPLIIAGTIGHSDVIDKLAQSGKLKDLKRIKGVWEATLVQIVEKPFPGVDRALVIVGSDRRGTAYGFTELSEKIGVSPWYWWADVPVAHRDTLAIRIASPQITAPAVKYRGIFINDEDWGLNAWAAKTFDPEFKNIGPKTYEKVFELLLRLRLNYIWPAMHACTAEFASAPENIALADKFGIVAGSSHCEPMLCNNVHWNQKEKGRWNYSLNRDAIFEYWKQSAEQRGAAEAVWTLGIRGIHDAGMQTPPTNMPGKISLVEEVFHDQRSLLDQYVTKQWGPIAQCFVPYKEVLPIYDAGLQVPSDVTLVWVDDNFGYIRRLSAPAERKRAGGAGVYWHMSYYGGPHSYTWINTTAPALMWEELHKAWENEARNLWVINVGDIKPMEIGIDYFARLAWDPEAFPLGGQRQFLHDFAERNFPEAVQPVTDLLMDYYRLGTIRKPELMERAWAVSLPAARADELKQSYLRLLDAEAVVAKTITPGRLDAYTETIGFPARVLGKSGLIFIADRNAQYGTDTSTNEAEIARFRSDLEADVNNFNQNIAGGKWNRVMPGLVTGNDLMRWNSQVRWPWGEAETSTNAANALPPAARKWRHAATADRRTSRGSAQWSTVEGLGPSGRAVALEPASLDSAWSSEDKKSPALEFDFTGEGNLSVAIDFLPTFRIYPGMKSRVAVSVDGGPRMVVEVPGSSGAENETGSIRRSAVQDNYARAFVSLPDLRAGKHTLAICAIDPGVVIDRIALP